MADRISHKRMCASYLGDFNWLLVWSGERTESKEEGWLSLCLIGKHILLLLVEVVMVF